ncbi:hypothetical protein SDC9_163156 [bioreactor metagenome]|uniref:Uncharacterized protein n=1 Tax=bioreactor metagenome TaxID=1076179 RepID=A0A645FPD8_9ZZZZ
MPDQPVLEGIDQPRVENRHIASGAPKHQLDAPRPGPVFALRPPQPRRLVVAELPGLGQNPRQGFRFDLRALAQGPADGHGADLAGRGDVVD